MLGRLVIVPVLAVSLVFSGYSSVASAAVISTQEALSAQQRAATETEVRTAMARADVRQAMQRMGVDPAQADARIAALSDAELLQVQSQFDRLPAAGDSGVLVVVGVVFIVLLILELTGVINIFNRV